MSKNVRVLAALMESEEDGENLLESSRLLAQALIDLMKAAEPETQEVGFNWLFSRYVTLNVCGQKYLAENKTHFAECQVLKFH